VERHTNFHLPYRTDQITQAIGPPNIVPCCQKYTPTDCFSAIFPTGLPPFH